MTLPYIACLCYQKLVLLHVFSRVFLAINILNTILLLSCRSGEKGCNRVWAIAEGLCMKWVWLARERERKYKILGLGKNYNHSWYLDIGIFKNIAGVWL